MWFLFLTYLTPAAEKTLCAAAKAASLQGYAQSVLPDSSSSIAAHFMPLSEQPEEPG